jgi:radical SAM superfamily enzyme YgiQ (UPF0313 family)
MSILLVSAGSSSFKGALWGAYDVDLPLNVAYVAAYLEQQGTPAAVVDLQLAGQRLEPVFAGGAGVFDAVGISANLAGHGAACQTAAQLRRLGFDGLLFAFGPLGLYLRAQLLEQCPELDAVVWGEEETTIADLVKHRTRLNAVAGICFRRGSQCVSTAPRPYLDDLDQLPFPARDKFDMRRYCPAPGKYYVLPQISLLSSRGCDHHCLFCEKTGGERLRRRSPANIAAEIDAVVARWGAREIAFVDEMFGADRQETLALAALLARRPYRVRLRISTRIDALHADVLAALKKVGLYSVGFGIESGSDAILAYNNKGITTDQVRRGVAMVKSLGLETRGYFMINMPGETRATVRQTQAFIRELNLDLVNIQIAYPFPNTAFRRLAERRYRIIADRWHDWGRSDGDDVVFTQADLTEAFLQDAYRRIIRRHFLRPSFIFKWTRRIKTFYDFKVCALQLANLVRN